jgi:5'-methylthioadenosine phosphorylase
VEKVYSSVPKVDYCFMGGSSTFSIRVPEDLELADARLLERKLLFQTPYGESPIMKLFEIGGKTVLTTKMHGRRLGVTRADSSRQVFWVLREAGVKQVVAEGGVGAVNHLLELRDLVFPQDYIDLSLRKDVELGGPHLLVMRDPVCPTLHRTMLEVATEYCLNNGDRRRIFGRGIYGVTDGRHWESRAEVQMMKQMGIDLAGQSMCPEVYLAREIGACFAGCYMVVNYAEGVIRDWSHHDLKDIFYNEARHIGLIMMETLRRLSMPKRCGCDDLKKKTLLVDREYADG